MTNKIVLRSIEQFLADFTPSYAPIMPLFMENAQQYAVEVGTADFKRATTVGDIRNRLYTPKDTELHQIQSNEFKKTFKKYFLASQYVQSNLQDRRGYETVVAEVLDEHNIQNDELMLGNSINSGLFTSSDANYVTNGSYEVQKDANGNHLADMYAKIIDELENVSNVSGRKLVMLYGANVITKFNSMFPSTNIPFAKAIADGTADFGDDVSFAKMPKQITPASSHGFLIITVPKVKLHYTTLPGIRSQGVNDEKEYAWTNFLMGSSMVDVLAKGAITKQTLTFEA